MARPKPIKICRYDAIVAEKVKWLWYPYIPIGKITLIQGDPGEGKTTLALNIAAHITTGTAMPNCDCAAVFGSVIYQSAEDSPADTIKPRLIAAGADCSKVVYIDKLNLASFESIDTIDRAIKQEKAKMLVLDPFQAHIFGGKDMSRVGDMRQIMSKLAYIASKHECAVVIIGHMNKSEGSKDLYRGLGSIDIAAAARSILLISRAEGNLRVIHHIKSSLAPEGKPYAFEIRENSVVEFFGIYKTADVEDTGTYINGGDGKREIANDMLINMLTDTEKRSTEVLDACRDVGISERTVNAAKRDLGVRSIRKQDGWYWML